MPDVTDMQREPERVEPSVLQKKRGGTEMLVAFRPGHTAETGIM